MAKQTAASATFQFSLKDAIGVLSIVLAALFLQTLLLPLRPFQSDESTYVYAAYALTRGLIPYREVFMAHPPLMYYAYSFFMQFAGPNFVIMRLFNVVVYLGTIILTFLMSKMILVDHERSSAYALVCAAIYAFYPSFLMITSTTALLENLLTFFTLSTVITYILYRQTGRGVFIFLCGTLIGLSVMTTFRAVLLALSLVLFNVFRNVWRRNYKTSVLNICSILSGALVPLFAVAGLLFIQQALSQFYLQTVYIHTVLYAQDLSRRLQNLTWYASTMLPLLVTGALGALYSIRTAKKTGVSLGVLPTIILGLVSGGLLLAFRNLSMHYFYFLSPYVAFLSVMCLLQIVSLLSADGSVKVKSDQKFALLTVFLTLLIVLGFQTASYAADLTVPYFRQTPYNELDFYIGRYIANVTSPTDKIWASEQAIGFFADRLIVAPYNSSWPFRGFFSSVLGYHFKVDKGNDMKDLEQGFISVEQLIQAWDREQVKAIVFIHGQGWVPYPDELIWNGYRNHTGAAEYIRNSYEIKLIVTSPSVPYEYHVWVKK